MISLICETKASSDERLAEYLENKDRPAYSAAEAVRKVKVEKQKIRNELLFLRSKLDTYEEYFPFLKELENEILNDREDFRSFTKTDLNEVDPVRKLLNYEEYSKLSVCQRNQLALDRYLSRTSKIEVGKMYERFLGWEFEKAGYNVQYDGLLLGLVDRGRDFILSKDGSKTIKVVQAKCWSQSKTIHEKHIFQLFGTTYELQKKDPQHRYQAVFVTTTALSEYAEYVAKLLKIQVVHKELRKDWPMIKCNIGSSGNKIYHLPFDQQYDKTRIDKPGEYWVKTVKEAEKLGFRRAYRWKH
ncbi:restriction endonuclease [Turicimonas muris]|uniref:restriction endonuclease n=3 Tax=Turicimonas muris TaxID=1796652 RepID=UPI0025A58235|nr:restriction endonuclease [Turicimonas muris]